MNETPTPEMLLAGSMVDWTKYTNKEDAARDVWNAMHRNGRLTPVYDPVGYAATNDLARLEMGVSCIDLYGEVAPKGPDMVPLYERPLQLIAARSQALNDIAAERRRQIEVEGWTPGHDDAHGTGEMAAAAACYAHYSTMSDHVRRHDLGWPRNWPWQREWWKPTDRRRDLVKAGALIVAEIERLDRATSSEGETNGQR